ncbi:fungal-specific transcription factor domain-containing protein [Penicillium cf. viridicatum]|uniref:Fungal-specific transcription factor domain-containing protein n=1 Tax=Penicillium cf. viridicatum TaxID=2972119 RepID=A0A9W9MGT6_9EURO|nr:fungal-specific transcription factor domain-containing protein [Penicillium cf. viridicatum]
MPFPYAASAEAERIVAPFQVAIGRTVVMSIFFAIPEPILFRNPTIVPSVTRVIVDNKHQSRRPPRVALSPSKSQNEASVDWQQDMAEDQEVQKRPSPHGSATTLGSRPPESNSSDIPDIPDIPDIAPGPPLSVSSSDTTFQMVLDSGVPWAALPATTVSSLHAEKANAPGDTMRTTQNNPFQLNQATITTDCPDTFIWDELSSLTPPFELGQETPEDDTLRNGILEELDALGVPDFGTRDPFDNLQHPDSPTADTRHSPSLPPACFPVKSLAVQQCLDLYFERFHPQWPIVHRSTFYPSAAAQDLISSMIMIGAWESGLASWMKIAERWGKSLVNRLSQNLDGMKFSEAYFRYCMMIAIFRHANLFEEQYNLTHDDPQDAIPTSWLIREKLKKLAFFAFRLDIYFYFLCGYNPVLRYDELFLTTPCSERLWEAMTVEEWHEIKRLEAKTRIPMLFMTLIDIATDCEGRATLPPLLEDDFIYGLCAMQPWVLRDINKRRSRCQSLQTLEALGIHSPPASSRDIEYWTMFLTTWRDCYRYRAVGSLLSSQKHREMTENSAMLLYHLSHMSLRVNLKAIKDLAVDRCHQPYSSIGRRQLESSLSKWVKTPDARLAMWHAAQVLKMLQKTSDDKTSSEGSSGSHRMDFMSFIALYEAGLVVWAYTRLVQVCDACSIGSTLQQANATDRDPFELFEPQRGEGFRQWLNQGGTEQIQGTILSKPQRFGDGLVIVDIEASRLG